MNLQNIIVYLLVGGAGIFLAFKFLKPAFSSKKKNNCDTNCDCH
jgi:uncharacterized membrane protein YuzA (DUF378 family)